MPADHATPVESAQGAITPARLQAFSDGVFAIAATLLVLNIKAPLAHQAVWSALAAQSAALAAYATSFLIIGVAWVHHHNLFHHVRRVDRTVLFLNLGMLLTISFLPVPTATLGNHLGGGDAVAAAVFYSASLAVTSCWFALLWNHLQHRPDLVHPAARDQAQRARRRSLLGPAGYLAAALLALLTPAGSLALNAAVVLYYIVGSRSPASRPRWAASPSTAKPDPSAEQATDHHDQT